MGSFRSAAGPETASRAQENDTAWLVGLTGAIDFNWLSFYSAPMLRRILSSSFVQTALLTGLVLVAMIGPWRVLTHLENRNFDFWASRFRIPENTPVAIVAIDGKSIRQIGDWPWPRAIIAGMVRRLSSEGAQAIGLCLLYTRPYVNPAVEEINTLKTRIQDPQWAGGKPVARLMEPLLTASQERLDEDAQLISAVRRAKNTVVPMRFNLDRAAGPPNEELSGLQIINSVRMPETDTPVDTGPAALVRFLCSERRLPILAQQVQETFDALAGKAGGMGHLNLQVDPDGSVRRLPLLIDYQGRLFPSLSLQLALKYVDGQLRDLTIHRDGFGAPRLDAKQLQLATADDYSLLLNHDTRWTRARTFSFVDMLDGTDAPGIVKGKIVLIGMTAEGVAPRYRMGSAGEATTVEVTADALARLLSPLRLWRPFWGRGLEIGALLYFALLLVLLVPRVNMRIGAASMALFLATWYALATGLLLAYGYWLKPFGPVLLGVCGFLVYQMTHYSRLRQLERLESNKSLGLSYQGQGMLDTALEKFMQCPVEETAVKNLLYNLGLDFERKRMFNKAVAVYQHICTAGGFKDIKERIGRLQAVQDPLGLGGGAKPDATLAAKNPLANPTFGRYEILSEVGRGAMGTVYLGRDPTINRKVAIKTLDYAEVEAEELADVKSRFFREAQAAGQLTHPNIVAIYDAGEEHDMAYIAMELLSGETLTRYCRAGSLLPPARVLAIIADVAAALDYAHHQGVIHRDIKPGNIMLLADGRVKVTDFGIARVVDSTQTRTGIILGTPSYMSPEQVAGKSVDGRSDLFSLGVVAYELLTGVKPFKGENISATLYAITHNAHPPMSEAAPEIPACCAQLVDRLLAKGVTRRFQSAAQVAKAIESCRAQVV